MVRKRLVAYNILSSLSDSEVLYSMLTFLMFKLLTSFSGLIPLLETILPLRHLKYLPSQATSHNPNILHYIDIDHVETQSSSVGSAMLMRPIQAETTVHGLCALFVSFYLVATGFYPFHHCRISAHACGFNSPYLHLDFVISSHIPQPYHFHENLKHLTETFHRFLTSRPCLKTLSEERGPLPQAAYNCGVSSLAKSAI